MARLLLALLISNTVMAIPVADALPNTPDIWLPDHIDDNYVGPTGPGLYLNSYIANHPPTPIPHNDEVNLPETSQQDDSVHSSNCHDLDCGDRHHSRDIVADAEDSAEDISARGIVFPPGFVPPPPGQLWPHSIVLPFITPKGFTGFTPGVGNPPRSVFEPSSLPTSSPTVTQKAAKRATNAANDRPAKLKYNSPTSSQTVMQIAARNTIGQSYRTIDLPLEALTPREAEPSLPMPTDYCSTVVYQTNVHRMNHSAPLVTYNNTLASIASKNIIGCQANPAEIVGSNFAEYWGTGPNIYDPVTVTIQAIKDWYDEEQAAYAAASKDYTTSPNFSTFGSWGHFSQMVWQNEAQIGCWSISCDSSTPFAKAIGNPDWAWAVVCASSPAGNTGDYVDNVKPPLGHPPSNYNIQNDAPCY